MKLIKALASKPELLTLCLIEPMLPSVNISKKIDRSVSGL